MPGEWASATATTIRRKTGFKNSWAVCAKWLADRMDLLPFFLPRYVPDAGSRIAHSFLCTHRSTVSNTYRTGFEISGKKRKSEAQATAHNTADQQPTHPTCAKSLHNLGDTGRCFASA